MYDIIDKFIKESVLNSPPNVALFDIVKSKNLKDI